MSRQSIEPPDLEGYEFLQRLGAGGFSDVFLYERQFPRQQVAIKVLDLASGDQVGQERFILEANAMASVSSHPYIVTIYHADISPEGRPFLVMEYYPGANFAERSRSQRLSVADVLRLGVQVSSAVETAHRAGILHRDIKPANILTSAYGRPGLSDFGIAASRDSQSEAEGLSIPWSPPEALSGDGASDERSDLYSLAATLYHLLEGHSPFERPGDRNRSIDLIDRIEREPVPRFERLDVPDSIYRLLAQAMAKEPGARPFSVAEFGRSLQAIEVEMRFDVTALELSETPSLVDDGVAIDPDAGSTRVKNPTVVSGQSRFQDASDTMIRNPSALRKDLSSPSAPIRNVPFAVPDEQGMQRITPRGPTSARTAPVSASYSATPNVPTMSVPGEDIPVADKAKWWRDRSSRTMRTVVIALAVIAVAIAGILAIKTLGGSSQSHRGSHSSSSPTVNVQISTHSGKLESSLRPQQV